MSAMVPRPGPPGGPAPASAAQQTSVPTTTTTTTTTTPECTLLDGAATAKTIRRELKAEVARLVASHGVTPGLGVVLVGSRPDSASYVRTKTKVANEIGVKVVDVTLRETASQSEVLAAVSTLNARADVHAILVQLPLPAHVDEAAVLSAIALEKDVDGFSAANMGRLVLRNRRPLARPCTPAGCVELLVRHGVEIAGKHAVVLGRSNIVGTPVAALLQDHDATVTVCHSKTPDVAAHVARADILVAAIGRPRFVKSDWLKPGVVVVDVGINSVDDPTAKRGYRLVGDVDFDAAKHVASFITPVPGGVGPMTVAMLMDNVCNLTRHAVGLPPRGEEVLEEQSGDDPRVLRGSSASTTTDTICGGRDEKGATPDDAASAAAETASCV